MQFTTVADLASAVADEHGSSSERVELPTARACSSDPETALVFLVTRSRSSVETFGCCTLMCCANLRNGLPKALQPT